MDSYYPYYGLWSGLKTLVHLLGRTWVLHGSSGFWLNLRGRSGSIVEFGLLWPKLTPWEDFEILGPSLHLFEGFKPFRASLLL